MIRKDSGSADSSVRPEKKDFIDRFLFNQKLEHQLRCAHIRLPVDQYLMLTVLVTMFIAIMVTMTGIMLSVLNLFPVKLFLFPDFLTAAIMGILIAAIAFVCIYFYPVLAAQGRKNKIEQDLPYAVTYMQSLSSTMTLYSIFRSVYEAADLYGEVSKECGLIVRDVELFGLDLITAVENTIDVTPSENFKELLNDLSLIYRSGGSLTNFFAAKSDSYREFSRQQMESLLQFLEMIAEVYVTAFVAGPIAICIMLVAQNLSGQSTLGNLMPIMLICLPIGAMILVAILFILLPPDNLSISKSKKASSEFGSDLLKQGTQADTAFIKQINKRKQSLRLTYILKHPVKFFISDYSIPTVLGVLLLLIVIAAWMNGTLQKIFPSFTVEVLICIAIIAFIIPLMAAYEIRKRYVTKIERELPGFLREISDMRDIGMTLQSAVFMLSDNKTGVLSSEIEIVSTELKSGAQLSDSLVRMEERIGLVSVKRAISLLVKASEITDYIREILAIAIADLEHYVKMRGKRTSVSFVYLAVIYLSFGIYLYCAYQMNVAFISSFAAYDLTFDLTANKGDMFHLGIILAFFSGIMAGQMSSNNILAGLKHVIILLAATIITFVYII